MLFQLPVSEVEADVDRHHGDVQNVEIYYYSETDHKWKLAPVNGIDHATNSVNVTIPGNAVFTLVHKN